MRIAVMQPAYLPYMGFFDLMDRVDTFVFLDDVQFERHLWQQRNFIKGPQGKVTLTVPVQRTGLQTLLKDALVDASPWRRKHKNGILLNYQKAAHLTDHKEWIEEFYDKDEQNLCELNIAAIDAMALKLGIHVRTVRSSTLGVKGSKVDRLVDICQKLGADTYLSPLGAFGYIDEDNRFAEYGITLEYQNFSHPTYVQLHGDFISHLSCIDLLFNEGGSQGLEILRGGRGDAFTHEQAATVAAKQEETE